MNIAEDGYFEQILCAYDFCEPYQQLSIGKILYLSGVFEEEFIRFSFEELNKKV